MIIKRVRRNRRPYRRLHWSFHRGFQSHRTGGVLLIAMAVMLAVALLAAQGMRLMTLVNDSYHQRLLQRQVDELLELGRLRLSQRSQAETFTVKVNSSESGSERLASITLEKVAESDRDWRITVRYPLHPTAAKPISKTHEKIVTWEGTHE